MKLHGNAALSLKKRRLLCRRRRRGGLVADGGGRGRRGQRAHGRQVGRAASAPRASSACSTALRRRNGPQPHPRGPDRGDRRAAAAALHRRPDRRAARDARDDRVRDPYADRAGHGSAGSGSSLPPLRAQAPRRADPRRRQEARPDRGRRRQAGPPEPASPLRRPAHRRRRQAPQHRRLGIRPCRVDDATRLAYAEVLADETGDDLGRLPGPRRSPSSAATASGRARPDRQRLALPLDAARLRLPDARHPPPAHRPYRPQTNGKAERFIRTMLGGWAYGAIYGSSAERTAALDGWLWRYNHERHTASLGRKPPSARLAELNNLLGSYT